jgi:hypothetical protein
LLATVLAVGAACASAPALAIEAWQSAIGYQKLIDVLGPNVPVGAGIAISQVEASEDNNTNTKYMPVSSNGEFLASNDPLGQAVQFTDASGTAGTMTSGHATGVGQFIYGNGVGLAKAANAVTVYEANHWMGSVLNYNGNQLPLAQPYKVQNHSWIGTFGAGNQTSDLSVLRRYDYVIETGDMTAVVGANNNNGTPTDPALAHPNMLVHSYNVIVAGRSDSKHSRGVTNAIYGPGRFRPDMVSAAPSTSVATAQISSAAAVLRGVVAGTDADRSETMKAILMAGATKGEFANFVDPATGLVNAWNHTSTRPLDDLFGAGELNVFNSYLMTVGGQHAGSTDPPATVAKSYGWDYQNRKADSTVDDVYYNFQIPAGSTATELSIMLAWNAKITDTDSGGSFVPVESLQNLDVRLFDSTASFLGEVLDQSVSTVDNVEHIYRTSLAPGLYTLQVSGAAGWDYGLAWRMATLFDQQNADFDGDGFVTGTDLLVWQRNLGTLVGADHAQGDADGDGDVDRDDLAVYTATVTPASVLAGSSGAAGPASGGNGVGVATGVPEPAAWTLAAAAAGLWAATRRRRH